MREKYRLSKFTQEQMDILRANPFTKKVDLHHIWFTLEFQNLFLARYEQGESSTEIFADLGYDIEVLGKNRIYNYPRLLYCFAKMSLTRDTLYCQSFLGILIFLLYLKYLSLARVFHQITFLLQSIHPPYAYKSLCACHHYIIKTAGTMDDQ